MTDEMIMDQLSKGYMSLVGVRCGYKYTSPTPDSGVDLTFCPEVPRIEPDGSTRWLDSDKQLSIQLKGAHHRVVEFHQDHLSYDLEVKCYNDLVYRRSGIIPLYLVLLVLPDSHDDWLNVSTEELALRECAFWWRPDPDAPRTANVASKRIQIPLAQRVTIDFFPDRFADCYGEVR